MHFYSAIIYCVIEIHLRTYLLTSIRLPSNASKTDWTWASYTNRPAHEVNILFLTVGMTQCHAKLKQTGLLSCFVQMLLTTVKISLALTLFHLLLINAQVGSYRLAAWLSG